MLKQLYYIILILNTFVLLAQEIIIPESIAYKSTQVGSARQTLVETYSPRSTFDTFLRLRDAFEKEMEIYIENPCSEGVKRLRVLGEKFRSIIDLSEVPLAKKDLVGVNITLYLMDIFGRIDYIKLDSIPGGPDFNSSYVPFYRFPKTPIRIVRIGENEQQYEYLFSGDTIKVAPQFLAEIESLPLRSKIDVSSWKLEWAHFAGPWIPNYFVSYMPEIFLEIILDTPVWKIILSVIVILITSLLIYKTWVYINFKTKNNSKSHLRFSIIKPILIILGSVWIEYVIERQINPSGRFYEVSEHIVFISLYIGWALVFYIACCIIFETFPSNKNGQLFKINTKFFILAGRSIGVIGSICILGRGAFTLGVPVMSITAGLGIGGFAIALAIRPSLENLFGGVILYLDQPIRMGDVCTFNEQFGIVKDIGLRSTQIRLFDRSVLTIPNAQFADLEIINWAECDMMLIHETIRLKYETSAEQISQVLMNIRSLLELHPQIDSETIRVRLKEYGESSLNIDMRIYAQTKEWNEFFKIREEVLLKIKASIEEVGVSFALPAQSLYLQDQENKNLTQKNNF